MSNHMNSHQTNFGLDAALPMQQARRRHRAAELAMLHVQYDVLCARLREVDAELERTAHQLHKRATEDGGDQPQLDVLLAYRQRLLDMRPRVEQDRVSLARRRHAQQRQLLRVASGEWPVVSDQWPVATGEMLSLAPVLKGKPAKHAARTGILRQTIPEQRAN